MVGFSKFSRHCSDLPGAAWGSQTMLDSGCRPEPQSSSGGGGSSVISILQYTPKKKKPKTLTCPQLRDAGA